MVLNFSIGTLAAENPFFTHNAAAKPAISPVWAHTGITLVISQPLPSSAEIILPADNNNVVTFFDDDFSFIG